MGKNRFRVLLVILALSAAMVSSSSAFDFTKIEKQVSEKTLDNGLKIIVLERHDVPVASFITFANVGGVDEPKGYSGLAHMFEHMAFKGTKTIGTKDINTELKLIAVEDSVYMLLRSERLKGNLADSAKLVAVEQAYDKARNDSYEYIIPNEYSQIVKREGGVGLNAGTGKDQTVYLSSYPSNKAELWMAMESDRFSDPVFREMYKERDVIMEERRESLEASPFGRLLDELVSAAYKAHPYGIPLIGHASDIRNFTREEAIAFFKTYYVPSNMVVSIAGDVNPDDIFKLADKYFSKIPYSPKPEPVTIIEPPQKGERRVLLKDPAQPLFAAAYHIPEGTNPDWPAIEALADYYGGGRTSLLYKKLVKEKKIAAEVGSWPGYPANKYPSLFVIYAVPTPGSSLEEIEQDIYTELDKIKNEPISPEDLNKIKARAKMNFINGLRDNIGMAIQLAAYQTTYGNWHQMFKELDKINALTADDIKAVANKYFSEDNRTVVVMETEKN